MIILEESIISYIFLSRFVPLSLKVLQIIKDRFSFDQVLEHSPENFEKLLLNLKNKENIIIRNIGQLVQNFKNKKNQMTFSQIEKELEICKNNGIDCLSYFSKNYPSMLKIIKRPPKLVFIKGSILPRDDFAVAIIGTRNPTPYGVKMTKLITKRLVKKGFTIVSGFAKGIDTIAMNSALKNGGRAMGVIASGILNLYPKENQKYVEKLVHNGALISERFPNDNVMVKALQMRNKLTSGLGLGNIFVEGNKFSGTKWQLKYGKEQNKPAIAVEPIDPECEQAYIPNSILEKQGGIRIKDLDDVDFVAELLMDEYQEKISEKKKLIQQNTKKQKRISDFK